MDFVKSEGEIIKRIRLALSSCGVKTTLFRNNTAKGWVGTIFKKTAELITLHDYRPLTSGLHVGSSDLIGWTSVEITPDMVGKKVAIFTAIECKSASGRASKEQLNFIEQVQKAGGRAGIARNETEAVNLVKF